MLAFQKTHSEIPLILIGGLLIFLCSCNSRITGYIPFGSPKSYRLKSIRQLSPELKESSGLCYFNSKFWTHNDSGGDNSIYNFNLLKNDSILSFRVMGSSNRDWESLDDDSLYVYIADVGDNFGIRENLFIYRVLKSGITGSEQFNCDTIRIKFPEKSVNVNSTTWSTHDCEAIAVIGDSIFLFTKNWIDYTSSVYVIPSLPGIYSPQSGALLRVNMLVTGADYDPCSDKLFLIGYLKYKPVLAVFPAFKSGFYNDKEFTRIIFPSRLGAQTEGISVSCAGQVFITSERNIYTARLFKLVSR